jgi:hypothetical protein
MKCGLENSCLRICLLVSEVLGKIGIRQTKYNPGLTDELSRSPLGNSGLLCNLKKKNSTVADRNHNAGLCYAGQARPL